MDVKTEANFLEDRRQPIITLGILFGVVGGGLLLIAGLLLLCRYLAKSLPSDDSPSNGRHGRKLPVILSKAHLRCAKIAAYFWPTDEQLARTRLQAESKLRKKSLIVGLSGTTKTAGFGFMIKTPIPSATPESNNGSAANRPQTLKIALGDGVDSSVVQVEGDNRKWLTANDGAITNEFFRRASTISQEISHQFLPSSTSNLIQSPSCETTALLDPNQQQQIDKALDENIQVVIESENSNQFQRHNSLTGNKKFDIFIIFDKFDQYVWR